MDVRLRIVALRRHRGAVPGRARPGAPAPAAGALRAAVAGQRAGADGAGGLERACSTASPRRSAWSHPPTPCSWWPSASCWCCCCTSRSRSRGWPTSRRSWPSALALLEERERELEAELAGATRTSRSSARADPRPRAPLTDPDVIVVGGGHRRPGRGPRAATGDDPLRVTRARARGRARPPPDLAQQRRDPRRHLLRARLAEGAAVRGGRARACTSTATSTACPTSAAAS